MLGWYMVSLEFFMMFMVISALIWNIIEPTALIILILLARKLLKVLREIEEALKSSEKGK